jgi:hypothetical protein
MLLIIAVVGSGIMATNLSTDTGLQLLENAAATAGALVGLILMFGTVSGAHFNPAVTLVDRFFGATPRHPRLRSHRSKFGRTVRRRPMDRRRLLVHVVNQFREPGGHDRPNPVGQFRRYQIIIGSDVHRHATARRRARLPAHPIPLPQPAQGRSR